NAGMTGVGSAGSSVFLWAGSTYANRNTAPIRFTRDGDAVFNKIDERGGNIGQFEIEGSGSQIGTLSVGSKFQVGNYLQLSADIETLFGKKGADSGGFGNFFEAKFDYTATFSAFTIAYNWQRSGTNRAMSLRAERGG